MNYVVLIIFISVSLLLLFFSDRIIYKDALNLLKVGNKYRLYEQKQNPYAPCVTIIEIKYNQYNEAYVKYEFPDGTNSTMSFKDFSNIYNVLDIIDKGES